MNKNFTKLAKIIQDRLKLDPERKDHVDTIVRMVKFATADKNIRTKDSLWGDITSFKSENAARLEKKEQDLEKFATLRQQARSTHEALQNKIDVTGLVFEEN